MINASCRKSAEISSICCEIKFNKYGLNIMPVINIPSNGGNFIFEHIEPSNNPQRKIIPKLVRNDINYSPCEASKKADAPANFRRSHQLKSGSRIIFFGRTSFPYYLLYDLIQKKSNKISL